MYMLLYQKTNIQFANIVTILTILLHKASCITLQYNMLELLTLTVLVTIIDALGHFETGSLQHSARGWGK